MSTDPLGLEEVARRAQWELSAEAAGVGTYVLHLPSGRLDMDERTMFLTGLTPETSSGRPEDVYAHIHPDEVADVVAAVERAVATAGAYSTEYRIMHPDGGHHWVAVRGQTLVDDDGTVTALVGALYDVTALREATTRVAEVLESMAVGYLSMDPDWRVTYVNAAAEHALGHPRADLVGGIIWDLFPATVGTEFEVGYRRAAETGEVVTFDAYYPAPLDAWYEVRATPERGGVALYFLDITARRAAQVASEVAARRLSGLAETALALVEADDVEDLVQIVAEQGLAALGCDGGAVAVPDPDDPSTLRSYVTSSYGPTAQAAYARLPLTAALPVCVAATTGHRVLVADRAASLAFSPQMEEVVTSTGSQAFASLPLRVGGQVIGVVTAGWEAPQDFSVEQVELLEAFAAQVAQALQRLRARQREQVATAAALRSAAQQAALVAVARDLGEAQSEADVLAVIAEQGAPLLQANGSALCLQEPDGTHLRILTTETYGPDVRGQLHRVPVGFPLPAVRTATTGTPFFHTDRAETLAHFPDAEALYVAGDVQASTAVPLRSHGRLLGSLSLSSSEVRTWRPDEQDLLSALAALTAQALDRIASHHAERTASDEVARFSETMQRSLLTSPPEPDHLQIAVRYSPAAAQAYVGGDWYDAFLTSTGVTSLVIGDVTGHDRHAAAAMAQLRNLLRGIGYTLGQPPALVLSALDRAVHDLDVGALASIVIAEVEQPPEHARAGTRILRWSNAGHPPPLLIEPDGSTRYLETAPDLLIGLDPSTARSDHTVVLEPGASVLLFTDGLIERRGIHLRTGLDWLAGACADLAHLSLEELCDALLAQVGNRVEDDVALLALRAHPEDRPRPPEAGPGTNPLHAPTLTSERTT